MAFDLVSPHLLWSLLFCSCIIHRMTYEKWKYDNFASLRWFFSVFRNELKVFNSALHGEAPASHRSPLNLNNIIFFHFWKYTSYFFSCVGPVHIPRMCFPSHVCLINSSDVLRSLPNSTQNTVRDQDTKGFIFDWNLINPASHYKVWTPYKQKCSFIKLIYQWNINILINVQLLASNRNPFKLKKDKNIPNTNPSVPLLEESAWSVQLESVPWLVQSDPGSGVIRNKLGHWVGGWGSSQRSR